MGVGKGAMVVLDGWFEAVIGGWLRVDSVEGCLHFATSHCLYGGEVK